MSKRKAAAIRQPAGVIAPPARKRIISNLPPYRRAVASPPPPLTNYKTFLNSLVGKAPANLTADQVNNWEDVNLGTPQGNIIDEIAKKFNNDPNKLGIQDITYSTDMRPSYYGMSLPPNSPPGTPLVPQMDLASQVDGDITRRRGPDPVTIGHELVHANDHQIDRLNPRVWQNLGNLAKGIDPNSGAPVPMAQSNFFGSIGKIQKKIDPIRQDFFQKYQMSLPKLQQEIANATQLRYKVPTTGMLGRSTDWQTLFNDINNVVTSPAPAGGVQNQAFHLPFASEFPAYMTENLTRRWRTNQPIPQTADHYGVPALSKPEARVLHSTLGDMETANPAADYPTMNQHIRERRNSIEQAYYPPTQANPLGGVPAGQQFFHGGHVKAKPRRYGLSSYLQG